jgi:hypothetical protein
MMKLTEEQREALGWALDMAYDDQNSYMSVGNPEKDYGDDWPDAALMKANYCRSIAEIADINGEYERWTDLAEQFEASAREYVQDKLTVDPEFVKLLAENVQRFLEHGHGEEVERD